MIEIQDGDSHWATGHFTSPRLLLNKFAFTGIRKNGWNFGGNNEVYRTVIVVIRAQSSEAGAIASQAGRIRHIRECAVAIVPPHDAA